ncbi:hypothetical protein SCHPADRAFT_889695 [Schizopora paradoxa]|uniref:Uncharacterized protein n=1 Tax=Schizopora paradoxa TaxID=27342 RepID=A0A0H2RQR3_9AGAM|nr:hypothetical protein SCHPADRAFT_889695 [Schizopora paradoxa]
MGRSRRYLDEKRVMTTAGKKGPNPRCGFSECWNAGKVKEEKRVELEKKEERGVLQKRVKRADVISRLQTLIRFRGSKIRKMKKASTPESRSRSTKMAVANGADDPTACFDRSETCHGWRGGREEVATLKALVIEGSFEVDVIRPVGVMDSEKRKMRGRRRGVNVMAKGPSKS